MSRVAWVLVVLAIFACAIIGSILDDIWQLHHMLPHGPNWQMVVP